MLGCHLVRSVRLVHPVSVPPGSHPAPDVCLCLEGDPERQRSTLPKGGGAGGAGDGVVSRAAYSQRKSSAPAQTEGEGNYSHILLLFTHVS